MSFKRYQTLAVTRRSSSLTLSTSASTWTRRSTLPAVGTSSAFFCCGHRVQGVSVRLPPVCGVVQRGCRAGGRGELGRDQRPKLRENILSGRERAHLILVRAAAACHAPPARTAGSCSSTGHHCAALELAHPNPNPYDGVIRALCSLRNFTTLAPTCGDGSRRHPRVNLRVSSSPLKRSEPGNSGSRRYGRRLPVGSQLTASGLWRSSACGCGQWASRAARVELSRRLGRTVAKVGDALARHHVQRHSSAALQRVIGVQRQSVPRANTSVESVLYCSAAYPRRSRRRDAATFQSPVKAGPIVLQTPRRTSRACGLIGSSSADTKAGAQPF